MLKTAPRRYLRGQAVNDEKFEILKMQQELEILPGLIIHFSSQNPR
ncbi:MAG: hypothetical protein ACR2IS_05205 [Nitrososphaeraceae archaeon]